MSADTEKILKPDAASPSPDAAQPPDIVTATLAFGDPSSSCSEKYSLALDPASGDPRRVWPVVNRQYGAVETASFNLRPGASYEVSLDHAGTRPDLEDPDYDYTLSFSGGKPAGIFLSDPDGLFGTYAPGGTTSSFAGAGKKATLYVVKVTVEVNDTAEENDDVVCRRSANPSGRPTIPCRIKAEGAPDEGVAVTLTGSKLRFPGENDTSKELTLPSSGAWVSFTISGQTASTAMGDAPIQVRHGGTNGDILAEKGVTVLWADISMRNAQGAGFSADNDSAFKPVPPLLGAQLLEESPLGGGEGLPSTISHVVELRGDVSPPDFPSPVQFPRDCTGNFLAYQCPSEQPVTGVKTEPRGAIGTGNDPTTPQFQDLLPAPNGRVYDIDIPGHVTGEYEDVPGREFPQDTILFMRCDFLQYVAYKGVRCSDDFAWFMRLTSKKASPPGTGDYIFYNRPGHNDNQSGTGVTSLSID